MEGNEHAVLLMHGLASSPLEMRYLATTLNRMGFTVSAPSLPRYGHGSVEEGCGTWEEWIDIAQSHFRELEGRYETVCLAGLSMGATLALATAIRERTTTALALLSLTLHYDGWVVPWYRFLFTPAYFTPIRKFYQFHEGEPYGLKNIQMRKRVAQAMAASSFSDVGPATLSMEQLRQARLLAGYAEENAAKAKSDLLIIHAIDDETASPKVVDFAMEHIGSPIKRKILLDNSYHIITMDNERELVARETGLFFQEAIRRKHATGLTQGPQVVNEQLALAKRLAELGG
jgi:carboxylesterase